MDCLLLLWGMLEMGIFTVSFRCLGPRVVLTFAAIMLYNDKQRKEAEEAVHRMVKRAIEMEGTVTGEHGVGLVKRDYLNHELGETTVDAMRKVSSNSNRLVAFVLTTSSSSWHLILFVC